LHSSIKISLSLTFLVAFFDFHSVLHDPSWFFVIYVDSQSLLLFVLVCVGIVRYILRLWCFSFLRWRYLSASILQILVFLYKRFPSSEPFPLEGILRVEFVSVPCLSLFPSNSLIFKACIMLIFLDIACVTLPSIKVCSTLS